MPPGFESADDEQVLEPVADDLDPSHAHDEPAGVPAGTLPGEHGDPAAVPADLASALVDIALGPTSYNRLIRAAIRDG